MGKDGLLADLDRCRQQHEAVVEQLNESYRKRNEYLTENQHLRAWLDHALRCDGPSPCPTCVNARAFLDGEATHTSALGSRFDSEQEDRRDAESRWP